MSPIQIRLARPALEQGRAEFVLAKKGFRPFFLLAGCYAIAIVPVWLLVVQGRLDSRSSFSPTLWHGHEMIFGYGAAVIAGFLLTATSRWTSRPTATGRPLLVLSALWALGRLALSLPLPTLAVAAIDVAFLPALGWFIGRAIVSSQNVRNYGVLAVVGLLALANALMHLDALGLAPGWGRRSLLFSTDLLLVLMLVIGGRVIPMFTQNATRVPGIRSHRALDVAAISSTALGALLVLAMGPSAISAAVSLLAGLCVLARTWHWGAKNTVRHPMLWILHVSHAFIGIGLLLRAASLFSPVLAACATHALTVGAIGGLTLGMMSRVSLGHTGRLIVASRVTVVAFASLLAAAALRISAPLVSSWYAALLTAAGTLWSVAFALFVFEYASILLRPRVDAIEE